MRLKLSLALLGLLVMIQQHGLIKAQAQEGTKLDPQQVEQLKKFIAEKGGQDMKPVTFEMLEEWFMQQAKAGGHITDFGYTRLFPFCITADYIRNNSIGVSKRLPKDSYLYKFQKMFNVTETEARKFYHYNTSRDFQGENNNFVTAFKFSRINTPEPDMVNLRQWMHIKIETEPIQGLYIQSIVGPLGIPSGEFSLDFPCKDFPQSIRAHKDGVGQLEYCMYRPKVNIVHPNVYVGFNASGNSTEWHVHFRWFDLTCMEMPYIQFVMMAVKNFNESAFPGKVPVDGFHFAVQFSPVLLNELFDTNDGTPYPYYPGWENDMYCDIKSETELRSKIGPVSPRKGGDMYFDPLDLNVTDTVKRVQANEAYEYCITRNQTERENVKIKRDEERYECPPGPFRCTSNVTSKDQITVRKERKIQVATETEVSKCNPCGIPVCRELNYSEGYCRDVVPPTFTLEKETRILTRLDFVTRGRYHGAAASVAFLFCFPMAQYIARFCKDMGGKSVFGNGPWMLLHVVFIFIGFTLLCDSAGNVFTNFGEHKAQRKYCEESLNITKGHEAYEDCMKDVAFLTPHNMLGMFTLLILLITLSTGFVRPSSNKLRGIIDMLHSHIGYFTWIMGVVSIFIAVNENHCMGGMIMIGVAFAIPLIFTVVGIILDLMEDKKLGIMPGRRQWPVYEQIELDKRGPCDLIKWIVFGVYATIMVAMMGIIVANTMIIEQSGEEGFAQIGSANTEDNVFSKMKGLFGECAPQYSHVKGEKITKQ